ncbi:MAG: GNAT family N-acetyltransferase [Sulfitobacter sp.]|nr:GNAT family N-acetyltransferase [Sulfitobacter sp.]
MDDRHNIGSDIVIRPGVVSDARSAATVHCQAALRGFSHIFSAETSKPTPASLTPIWEALLSSRDAHVLVAEDRSEVIGVAAVAADKTVPTGTKLSRLYVTPPRWRAGIGSLLHDHAVEHARDLGAAGINLWVLQANHRARAMYERRGWQHIPGPTMPNEEPGVIDVLYQLAL